ncbi:diacylglycerol kinase family protein [Xenophilus arseniciresistens]|uniref:Diacylglycerol kinase family protein n=1 Tax=Xenophilus arseniciresistens TaxID=1283306 RepID=A0AAE3T154_9BURK|nr:diacylglycerol kinase family protein [Xenophilus arseniciresistens]MDA7417007.1 diacylglycerol kinase family protein [Xenophilus arseniciresistens]
MSAPVLANPAPLFVVFNPKSGRGTWPDTQEALRSACRQAGRPLHLLPLPRHQPLEPVIARAVQGALGEGGIVVAAGGDGTINAVAHQAVARGCAFGVLPQGTFNYFSRAHGLSASPQEAVAHLLQGRPEPVQVGLVNERTFLVNASMGFYARLLQDRESYKARYGRSRGVALLAALFTLMRGFRTWELQARWAGRTETLRTPTLFVGNNPLQFEQVGVEQGEAVEQGELAAIALEPLSRAAMLGLLVQAGLGRLDKASEVRSLSFRELEVAATQAPRGQRVRVATDGELRWMQMPLRFRVSPKPLWLVKPASLERERG